MELAIKARWCRHYAEGNYLALRKIAKKRDRLLGGKVGEEFIQVGQLCYPGSLLYLQQSWPLGTKLAKGL